MPWTRFSRIQSYFRKDQERRDDFIAVFFFLGRGEEPFPVA